MSLLEIEIARDLHPVDVIEHVAHANEWAFERTGEDEIAITVEGNWTDYQISFLMDGGFRGAAFGLCL